MSFVHPRIEYMKERCGRASVCMPPRCPHAHFGWWEVFLKSADGAGTMPADHLRKHGTSAWLQALYFSFSGETTQRLRGNWECLRGGPITFGVV